MISYFVSYAFMTGSGQSGFGHAEVPRSEPITDIAGVRAAARAIERTFGVTGVTVLYWRPFERSERDR